mmetsp:Transcript_17121/g.28880  ORF Transcript_17121/g.28880 Transcript_17121/m.28880 type:complete len:245 (+) Transcript_17121:644-1378(+)
MQRKRVTQQFSNNGESERSKAFSISSMRKQMGTGKFMTKQPSSGSHNDRSGSLSVAKHYQSQAAVHINQLSNEAEVHQVRKGLGAAIQKSFGIPSSLAKGGIAGSSLAQTQQQVKAREMHFINYELKQGLLSFSNQQQTLKTDPLALGFGDQPSDQEMGGEEIVYKPLQSDMYAQSARIGGKEGEFLLQNMYIERREDPVEGRLLQNQGASLLGVGTKGREAKRAVFEADVFQTRAVQEGGKES